MAAQDTTIQTSNGTYRAMGTTDDVTTCDHCGKTNLKKTVRLGILDADGNVDEVTYYGSDCATRALGVRKARLDRAVLAADNERRTNEELLTRWAGYLNDGEAGVTRFIANNWTYCRNFNHTRESIARMIADTVAEIQAKLA